MPQDRPPLAALIAFAAAARRESLREAALDLGVTPSAVSHQIRALESWVGGALFQRSVRRVTLTPLGAALGRDLGHALDRIDTALARARADLKDRRLRISSLPLFTNTWLVPRLARFQAAFPDLAIDIDTGSRIVDLETEPVDIAIRNVASPSPALWARKLIDLKAMPLCAPEVARTLAAPADLANVTLIHLSVGRVGWRDWFQACGLPETQPRGILSFDTLPSALEAAALGRGVVLGLSPFVWDSPVAQRLVSPFGLPPQSAGAYYLVTRQGDRRRTAVAAFVEWMVAEMRTDLRRLQALERTATRRAGQS
jgi:LysR family glycine cleavage system transcriptional activator